jgi:hypothetical protein
MITVADLVEALSRYDQEMPVAVHLPEGQFFGPDAFNDFALCTSTGWLLIDLDGEWTGE